MKFSLMPELTVQRKEALSAWITATLNAPELTQSAVTFPEGGSLVIYRDGRACWLNVNDSWQWDGGNNIYIGRRLRAGYNQPMPMLERVGVIGTIISLCELWEVHHEKYIEVASRALIDTYTGVMSGMVQTEAAVSGLAFNADRSLTAARVGDCYHLPDGSLVEIDDTWTVIADRPSLRAVPIA